jgi:tetratricopeptide (TPR) repeat protein
MKPKFVRILVWSLVGCVVLAACGYGGYRGYKSWRQKRFVKQARQFLESGEERKALISLQRAIRSNAKDVEALRLMAGMAEREGSPAALVWRQRVVDLVPDSMNDRLSLAQNAVMFRDFGIATNALAGVLEADRKTAEFHNVAGAVASTLGQLQEAEAHFAEAARINTADPSVQLNLAVVRLQTTNAQSLAAARTALSALTTGATNSSLRCRAYRELVYDALRSGQTNQALTFTETLLKEPEAAFSDRLLRLDVLGANANTNIVESLVAVRNESTNSLAAVNQMILWEMKKIHPARILDWIGTLPEEYQTNAAISLMTSDVRVVLQDWAALAKALETQNWGAMEFMRHAFRSLALRRQNLKDGADVEWGLTMKATGSELGPLNMLLRVAAQWRMPEEMREILNVISTRHPKEQWAAQMLIQNLYNEGQTRPLLSLLNRQLAANPGDLTLKNNVAMTAMLLEANELKPHDLARQVFDASPTNRAFVSSYAFSLHQQGRHEEALTIMDRLSQEQREVPSIAGYYALILKANGKNDLAKRYFELAKDEKMLPEERKLMDRSQAGL